MKRYRLVFPGLIVLLLSVFILKSCVIKDPKPEDCLVKEITVSDIYEGTSYDIVLKDNGTDAYYINRGLENGLTIEGLKATVLNKKVTLHLPKFTIGTSEHIAQLAIGNDLIYTEFNTSETALIKK